VGTWRLVLRRQVHAGRAVVEAQSTPPTARWDHALTTGLVSLADAGVLAHEVDTACIRALLARRADATECAQRLRAALGDAHADAGCDVFGQVRSWRTGDPRLVPQGERPVAWPVATLPLPVSVSAARRIEAMVRADPGLFGVDDAAAFTLHASQLTPGAWTTADPLPQPAVDTPFTLPDIVWVRAMSDGPFHTRLCVTGHPWPSSLQARARLTPAQATARFRGARYLRTIVWDLGPPLDADMGGRRRRPVKPATVTKRERVGATFGAIRFVAVVPEGGRVVHHLAYFVWPRLHPGHVRGPPDQLPTSIDEKPLGDAPYPAVVDAVTGKRLACSPDGCGARYRGLLEQWRTGRMQ